MLECREWGGVEESHSLRKEVDTPVLIARQQQGEQTVAGAGIVFYLTDNTDAW